MGFDILSAAATAPTTSDITTAISAGVTAITDTFNTVTGWWFFPIVVGFFVAGLAITIIAGFFGKRKGGKKKGRK